MNRPFCILLLSLLVSTAAAQPDPGPTMIAHFIDVGQADATLLEFPCGAVLIDAGAQDSANTTKLVAYLNAFFDERTDLNDTLNSIIITHTHIDHTRALREIVDGGIIVERYFDNAQLTGSGTGDPNWIRRDTTRNSDGSRVAVFAIEDSAVTALSHRNGLTNGDIDPLSCPSSDPQSRILSGRLDDNPGWTNDDFQNKNNHSIVVRVDFGESSFLFTGDLETHAIELLVDYYWESETLDVDIYQVGHHGSHNGTTLKLLAAMRQCCW